MSNIGISILGLIIALSGFSITLNLLSIVQQLGGIKRALERLDHER